MTNGSRSDALAADLFALASEIEWPSQPDMAPGVRRRIAEAEAPLAVGQRIHARRLAVVVSIATLALVASGVLVFSKAARTAVADWLGVGGVRIEFGERPEGVGGDLALGRRVSAEDAAAAASFTLRGPHVEELGDPSEYYVDERIPGAIVSLVYEASEAFPPAPETDVGLLVTEFQGGIHEDFYKKLIADDTVVHEVIVEGGTGLWLGGDPHYLYRDVDGGTHEETFRMAGNTLLWQRGGITYRLESALGKEASLEIAESFGDL